MEPSTEAAKFLNAFYGEKDPAEYIGVFDKRRLVTRCFLRIEDASAALAASPLDTYIHINLSRQECSSTERFRNATISSVTSLCLDVDIAGPGHAEGKNYPPDITAAKKILQQIKFRPTAVIHSGGGLQAWYGLKEPYRIDTEDERARVTRISRGWTLYAQETARRAGQWDMDSVFDLARILRPPGTQNGKLLDTQGIIRPVRLLQLKDAQRYNLDDFEAFLEERGFDAAASSAAADKKNATFQTPRPELHPGVPTDKLAKLLANRRAAAAWNWTPNNPAKLKDPSISAYAQQLAHIAAGQGWSDQEIANLIYLFQVEARPKHNDRKSQKIKTHYEYYFYPISKAREHIERDRRALNAKPAETQAAAKQETKKSTGKVTIEDIAKADPKQCREIMAKLTGAPTFRIFKVDSTPPTYILDLGNNRRRNIGEAENLIGQSKFRTRLYEMGIAFAPVPRDDWHLFLTGLLRIEEHIEMPPESREEGQIKEWIMDFLQHREWTTEDPNVARRDRKPLEFDGAPLGTQGKVIGIDFDSFFVFLQTSMKERNPKRNALYSLFRQIGCKRYAYQVQEPKKTTMSLWVLPGTAEDWQPGKP